MGLWEVFFFPDSSHEFQVITGKAYTSREYLRVFPGKWVFVRVRAVQGDSSGLKKMTLDFDSIGPGATHHRRPGGGRAEGLHPRLPQGRVDAAAHRPRPPLPPGALRGRDRRMNERTIVLISKGFVFFFKWNSLGLSTTTGVTAEAARRPHRSQPMLRYFPQRSPWECDFF